jgi:hypothetical protein
MRWIVVPMIGLAAYIMLSGVSTELQQWNPNAPMPDIGGLSGNEIKSRIQSSIKSFEDSDREDSQRAGRIPYPNSSKNRN